MHDGMQYDPIEGQGHEPFIVGNLAIFNSYFFYFQKLSRPSVSYGANFRLFFDPLLQMFEMQSFRNVNSEAAFL